MAETPLFGQVSIVTGASRGIGRAVAVRLASLGSTVVVTARSGALLADLVAEIERAGGNARALVADLQDPRAAGQVVESTLKDLGRIDILVNNAGIGHFGTPLHETSVENWSATLATNLTAVYLAIRAVAPHFIHRRGGHIINIASLAGHNPVPGAAAYAASKWGLRGLTVSVAEELRAHGIRVSMICPGSVDTDLSPDLVGHKDRGRMLRGTDIANLVEMVVRQQPQSFVSEILVRPTLKP